MFRSVLGSFLLVVASSAFGGHAAGPVVTPENSVLGVGDTTVLSAVNWPGGLSSGFPYSWQFESDNPQVAEIHGFASGPGYARFDPIPHNGEVFVTGVTAGVAHVRIQGFAGSWATVTVEAPQMPVVVSPSAVSILSGQTATLSAVIPDANGVTFAWYLGRLGDATHFLQASTNPILRLTPVTFPTAYVWVRALSTRGESSAEAKINIEMRRSRAARH